jgi:pilus assembly protein Flp/PilA
MAIIQLIIFWLRNTITPKGQLHHDGEAGQGLVEYALILVLVSVASMALMMLLGPQIANMFTNIIESMRGAGA